MKCFIERPSDKGRIYKDVDSWAAASFGALYTEENYFTNENYSTLIAILYISRHELMHARFSLSLTQ